MVDWGEPPRLLRLSPKYKMPIVPVAASGTDDVYTAYQCESWEATRHAARLGDALWTGIGPLGLFPFSPAFPVKIRQFIGQPIRPVERAPGSTTAPVGRPTRR